MGYTVQQFNNNRISQATSHILKNFILRLGNNNSCVIQVTLERSNIKILNDTNFLNLH